jgi:hypothetical protein
MQMEDLQKEKTTWDRYQSAKSVKAAEIAAGHTMPSAFQIW